MDNQPKPRREFLQLAESCGAHLTGKPDGSEPITLVFPIKAWRAFDVAIAAQSAGVPDVSAMARVLSDRSADACNIDRTDNWAMYGQEYIEDVQAMLSAAPAQPAALAYKDDPRSPSELSLAGCNCVRFGEGNPHWPCKIHRAEQGEVQRLREALGEAAQSLETISSGAGLDEFMKDASDVRCYARSRAGVARSALAASTGQEV